MRAPFPPFGASPPASAVACSHAEVDQDSKVSAVVDIARHLLAAHGKTELLSGSQVPPPLPGECAAQTRPVCLCRLRLTPYAPPHNNRRGRGAVWCSACAQPFAV